MREIFVFGSNLSGIHGAGAADFALKHHGARMGYGVGLQGDSYALPTKDMRIRTLPLHQIGQHVHRFITFAAFNQELMFKVTRVGCGLAGYTDEQIAPLFAAVVHGGLVNVRLPVGWRELIVTGSRVIPITDEFEPEYKPEPEEELWEADPNCTHDIQPQPSGGVKCTKCSGWFCH